MARFSSLRRWDANLRSRAIGDSFNIWDGAAWLLFFGFWVVFGRAVLFWLMLDPWRGIRDRGIEMRFADGDRPCAVSCLEHFAAQQQGHESSMLTDQARCVGLLVLNEGDVQLSIAETLSSATYVSCSDLCDSAVPEVIFVRPSPDVSLQSVVDVYDSCRVSAYAARCAPLILIGSPLDSETGF